MPSLLYLDLVRDEGKKLVSYQDTKGFWTIGVGHLLGKTRRMTEITEEECQALFAADAAEAELVARRVLDSSDTWHLLDWVRERALINIAFNRGETNMRNSTTITPAIRTAMASTFNQDEAWKAVAQAIVASPWADVIGARAGRLAYMLETGKDPQ